MNTDQGIDNSDIPPPVIPDSDELAALESGRKYYEPSDRQPVDSPIDDFFSIDSLLENLSDEERINAIGDLSSREPVRLAGDDVLVTNWWELQDEDAPERWGKLKEWVDWFLFRFEINDRRIPPCWFMHGPLVEELSALRAAYIASFDEDKDSGYGPVGWLDRKQNALYRIGLDYTGECANKHVPIGTGRRPLTPHDTTLWDEWVNTAHNLPSATKNGNENVYNAD